MNKQELQYIDEYSRNAIEKLNHALNLLSHPEDGDDDSNIENCIALARDLLSEGASDLEVYIEKLINEIKCRMEGRGVVVGTRG